MKPDEDHVLREVKAMPYHEVARWAKLGQVGFKQVAAEQELQRRQWWREFLTKGIVAWIALGLSVISLALQFHNMKP